MKAIMQLKRSEYFIRHVKNFLPHLTMEKINNLMLNLAEEKRGVCRIKSKPLYIKIEPTSVCHLKCPGCQLHTKRYVENYKNRPQISLDNFKKIIDPLSSTLLGISLSNFGEPLMHREIASFVRYAHSKNSAVSFPTNLSIKMDRNEIESLVDSGLDSLNVSLDGTTKEAYEKYRIGGDFGLVLKNVSMIAEAKSKLGLTRPKVIWKFIIFDHNKHQISEIERLYRKFGFEGYEVVQDYRSTEAKKEKKGFNEKLKNSKKGCFWLWHTMIIGCDGEVFPCCLFEHFGIGNAIETNTDKIWFSEKYNDLREGSIRRTDKLHPVCRKCLKI